MRFIVLDTETTGLYPFTGDRLVEIGALEIKNRNVCQAREFHQYINPQRDIPEKASSIHGIYAKDIADKPIFSDIAKDFLDFIGDATLIIHNAKFDLQFIMHELQLAGLANIHHQPVIDTLALARSMFPRQRNNLDALCDRLNIDRSHREKHGALLDSQILAQVYLAMTGGKQRSLHNHIHSKTAAQFVQLPVKRQNKTNQKKSKRPTPLPSPQDMEEHNKILQRIQTESQGKAIWLQSTQEAA